MAQPESETKAALEKKKLKLEVKELQRWHWKLLGGVLTVIVSVSIAVGGWIVQRRSEQGADEQKERHHRDEIYIKTLEDFGSINPVQRTGAAVALARFTTPSEETSNQTIAALVNRLAVEEDSAVLGQILFDIQGIGRPALKTLAVANRLAASLFATASGRYVGLEVASHFSRDLWKDYLEERSSHRKVVPPDTTSVEGNYTISLPPDSVRLRPPKESLLLGFHSEQLLAHIRAKVGSLEQAVYGNTFETSDLSEVLFADGSPYEEQYQSAVEDALRLHSPDSTELGRASDASLADVERNAKFLVTTTIGLVNILRSSSGTLKGERLKGIVLFSSDLSGLDLHGADLARAFLVANLDGSDMSYCDLSGAYIRNVSGGKYKLVAATLKDTRLPKFKSKEELPDLTGADWWHAHSYALSLLIRSFPRQEHEKKRTQLLKDWYAVHVPSVVPDTVQRVALPRADPSQIQAREHIEWLFPLTICTLALVVVGEVAIIIALRRVGRIVAQSTATVARADPGKKSANANHVSDS